MGHWFDLLRYRVAFSLKAEASKNFLGWALWLIEPLLVMSVFYLVFGVFFQRGGEGFAPFLLVGIVNWLWFSSTVGRSAGSIRSARGLIQQVYVPKVFFPLVTILTLCVKQAVIFGLLLSLLLVLGFGAKVWVYLPLIIVVQLLLNLAVALLAASLVPIVPDLSVFIPPCLQMLMFCSGVFYSVETMPEFFREYFLFNPVANIIHQYRQVLLDGNAPDFTALMWIALGSFSLILMVIFFLMKFDRKYPRYVL